MANTAQKNTQVVEEIETVNGAAEAAIVQDLPAAPEPSLEARMRSVLTGEANDRRTMPGGSGLLAARHDLENRSREATKMVRMVDRQRKQLDAAEAELDLAYDRFARIVPTVKDSATALRAAIRSTQGGDAVDDLVTVFGRNTAALDELEAITGELNAQLLWLHSAWDQYAKTVIASQRLRHEGSR